jgi:hypothetical protein
MHPVKRERPLCPPRARWSRTIAQCFLHLCHLDPTLLNRVGAYEASYGARLRKPFRPSRPCDSRRLQCGGGRATGSRPSGSAEVGLELAHSLGLNRMTKSCVRGGPLH